MESGSHDELMEVIDGHQTQYKKMYDMQSHYYQEEVKDLDLQ